MKTIENRVFLFVVASFVFSCGKSPSQFTTDNSVDAASDSDADADSDSDVGTDTGTGADTYADAGVVTIGGVVKIEGTDNYVKAPASGTLCVIVLKNCPQFTAAQGFLEASCSESEVAFPDKETEVGFAIVAPRALFAAGRYHVGAYVQEAGGDCTWSPAAGDPASFSLAIASSPNSQIGCADFSVLEPLKIEDMSSLVVKLNLDVQRGQGGLWVKLPAE